MTSYIFQDGRDFYEQIKVIDGDEGEGTEGDRAFYISAPFEVKDHDVDAAKDARRWFEKWCAANKIEFEFI